MKLSRIFIIFSVVVLTLLTACKTSEKNYRQAYERAIAGREVADSELDSTIYGKVRRDFTMNRTVVDGDTVDIKVQQVKVTADGGGINESLRQYNVVAAQFKQLFTAKSMRERLFAAGYPGAFVIETAEPYYYVVTGSYSEVKDAVTALKRLKSDDAFTFKAPLPFILERAQRR